MYWGYHTLMDCSGCSAAAISSETVIYNFMKNLVRDIDMVAYGEPQIVRFGSGDKFGITAVQLIETSSITIHFVEENNTMYLDVFSCKEYDPAVVENLVRLTFGATKIRKNYITRNAD